MPVTPDDVRDIALALPRAFETETREATKYKAGRLVFAASARTARSSGSASRRRSGTH